jgi:hypothetical protein
MAHRITLKVRLVCALVCALVLSAIAVLAVSPAHGSGVRTVCPGPSYFGGDPAIRPRNDCAPAYTEQDVRAYLAANLPLGLPNNLRGVGDVQIDSIRFLRLRELRREPDATVWLPPDRLACFVALHGTFFPLRAPPGANRAFHSALYLMFDAHSGNLLVP